MLINDVIENEIDKNKKHTKKQTETKEKDQRKENSKVKDDDLLFKIRTKNKKEPISD